MRKPHLFRWHRRWQLDFPWPSGGWLSTGLSWERGLRPIWYRSPDGVPPRRRAKPWWWPNRYRGYLDEETGAVRWKDFRRHLKSRYHVAVMRLDNRWQDLRAVLAGACNRSTWVGVPSAPDAIEYGYAGGYSHWRCARERGHEGPHRFHNYVWGGEPGDRVLYDALPVRTPDNSGWYNTAHDIPFAKLTEKRHAVDTRRRSRIRARLSEKALNERLARRE